jgi:tRNA-specific 2-thiouridylase
MKKVIVAISGGVDSSVSAFLLKKEGYEVIGVYMRLKNENPEAERSARAVSDMLKIKFYPINLKNKFNDKIIKYFLEAYNSGLTPNPCVKCNRLIKFGELLRLKDELKADYLATGHYVRNIKYRKGLKVYFKLKKGIDETKDQSYFLYHLNQKKLKSILFPLGDYKKSQVKKMADKEKLPFLVSESQDICFLEDDHNIFLKKNLKLKKGKIKDLKGKVLGEHKGLALYTVGQRKGIEIGGTGPYYAVKFDYKTNTLFVSGDREDENLYKKECKIKDINWVSGITPKMPLSCEAVIRYRHKAVECQVKKIKESSNKLKVVFKEKQRAITPGQSLVLYKGDEVLGGGIILDFNY